MTTFLSIAENSKLEFKSFHSEATGKLEMKEGVYMITEIILKPKLTILSEEEKEKIKRILQKSEKACLISNSVKSEIKMEPEVLW
ncbi:hypothetical protein BH09BAC2_BH09BAC2_19720 [soil metagenome]